jgi:hypothetical protein
LINYIAIYPFSITNFIYTTVTMGKENPGQGFEYPATEVSWLKRDVLLFAASIGCTEDELHFLYELHPKFQVFPTYPIILRKLAIAPSKQANDN